MGVGEKRNLGIWRRLESASRPAIERGCFKASRNPVGHAESDLCLYWPLGTVVITGPKALDFYADFCAHRATSVKSGGKDILSVTLVPNSEH
jgi:hypothetical protein